MPITWTRVGAWDLGYWVQAFGPRVQGLGFRVGFRVPGSLKMGHEDVKRSPIQSPLGLIRVIFRGPYCIFGLPDARICESKPITGV